MCGNNHGIVGNSASGVMADELDSDIVVNEFELQSLNNIPF